MITVREVKTKKEQRDFIRFPLRLYKNNPYFVPLLYADEKKLFQSDYMYYDQAKAVYYNAYLDGKMVGRISGILQYAANEKWQQKRVRFTRFDAIDNQEVASALFQAIETWAKQEQMEEIVGPLGFSDQDREGLLIEGFSELSTFEEQYNYPYYADLIEGCGFQKEVDWVERKLKAPAVIDERIKRISDLMLRKYKLHYGTAKNTKEFLNKYADQFFEIAELTYRDLYATVPFTDRVKKELIQSFKLIIDLRYVAVLLDENEKVVCFGIAFPSIGKALQKSGGRLSPLTIFKLFKSIRFPKIIDLGLIGVLPEYQNKGVSTALIYKIMEMLSTGKVAYAETNLNLEDNVNIINQWKNFDSVQHKRRRAYVKKI